MKTKDRCIIFLEQNGWKCDIATDDYTFYYRDCDHFGIDINDKEIVIIADIGDIENLPINYYALIGFLMEYRQIDCGYTSVK